MPASMLPATEICTPPWNPLVDGLPAWKAAPARTMRSVTSRPWSGSATIRSCSTTVADAGAPHVHERRGGFHRHRLLEIADGQLPR